MNPDDFILAAITSYILTTCSLLISLIDWLVVDVHPAIPSMVFLIILGAYIVEVIMLYSKLR